jgi:hypothetical protein
MAVRLSVLRAGRPLPSREIPGTHFCWRLSRPQGHSAAGRIRWIEKIHIGTRTCDLPACSIVPQLRSPYIRANMVISVCFCRNKYLIFEEFSTKSFLRNPWGLVAPLCSEVCTPLGRCSVAGPISPVGFFCSMCVVKRNRHIRDLVQYTGSEFACSRYKVASKMFQTSSTRIPVRIGSENMGDWSSSVASAP